MSETVVHGTTLEQWQSVLDVWFKQGYSWFYGNQNYRSDLFNKGRRNLLLYCVNDIMTPSYLDRGIIEYSEFMAQKKDDKEVKTYYVTKEQLDVIEDLRTKAYPIYVLIDFESDKYSAINKGLDSEGEKALLRYLGGDETIEFRVKEPLYHLRRVDSLGDTVYMRINGSGTPSYTSFKYNAFTAPLDEIKKWQTPAWEIEKAD